jgi:ABC-type transport system involved in multi-copper enzyme maturation permease subunit
MGILTIAHLTFHEARRRKVLLAALLLGLLFVGIYAAGFYFVHGELQADVARAQARGTSGPLFGDILNMLVVAGLYAVNFLMVMMAVLTPVDTLSGEIASGAIQTLVTKPLRRAEIVLGKWLGFWVMLLLYLVLLAGGVLLTSWAISGYAPPNLPQALGLLVLEGTLLLSLAIAGGTRLSTLANGVLVFGLYGLAFIGGWIERIGTALGNDTARNIGVLASLVVPSEALWQLAAYYLQTPFMRQLPITPFSSGSVPSPAMVAWAGGYVLLVLAFAVWSFSRRDL